MTEHKNKLAIIIPTKDRPEFVERLLNAINGQTQLPDQIIIADGGDIPIDDELTDQFPGLSIDRVNVRPPGLTKQKNYGVATVKPGIDLVCILDDDIVLERDALECMYSFWADASEDVGGACFNITNARPKDALITRMLKKIFFIDNREPGSVSRSGCITPIWDVPKTMPVRWLGGGYTTWRMKLFNEWGFDEWFPANGLLEDVHFSYRAGKKYQLMVVADAKAQHLEAQVPTKGEVLLGKRQMTNWTYFVSNHSDLSMALCLWSCIGRMSVNLTTGILRHDMGQISRAYGNLQGLGMVGFAAVIPGKPRARA